MSETIKVNFEHHQSAHCENGAVSNLLRFHKLVISEPMVFGIGSGLFFSYMPFVKLNGLPVVSYRILPGWIFSRVTKRLGIKMESRKFSSEKKAMEELDKVLAKGLPVGMLTSVFYLPYLPPALRFHFNAHNIVVIGKAGNKYLVSDPVLEGIHEIEYEDLVRARFAKGTMPPKGRMYYPTSVPSKVDLRPAIVKGIKQTATDMLTIPVPFFGLKGAKYLAKKMRNWPQKLGDRKAILYLGQVIRMQEEIGTGGAGFRFIFAAFLQEAATELKQEWLRDVSKEVTAVGDRWRDFAFEAGRICKGRSANEVSFNTLADIILECAEREKEIFRKLKKISLN
ncbi:MAG: BtrH N-terminal domain-containing protein [Cytophagaceae bacterium]